MPPKKTPRTEDIGPTLQGRTHFDPSKVPLGQYSTTQMYENALGMLVRSSVKDSSNAQYDSRLRTLEKFLRAFRGSDFADAITCSKIEYVLFLANWREQGMGPARGTHCALLQLHRRFDVSPSFLDSRLMWKCTDGAGTNYKRSFKGVLTSEEQEQFDIFLDTCAACDDTCGSCHGKPALRRRIRLGYKLLKQLPIRPGNLKDFEIAHFELQPGEEIGRVFVKNWKTSRDGAWIPLPRDVLRSALEAYDLSDNVFLFPRCIDKHLTAALREAELVFEWPEGLVYTVHCVRHTCMTNADEAVKGVTEAAKKALSGISTGVFDGTYALPLEKRTRRV